MALFKISKGKSNNLPTNKVDGYCYVTTNDHKFYVDYTKDDGTLDRFALNAVYADTAQKLGTINVGNSSKPIYLEKGAPKECVDFLPLSAGENKKLIGPLGLTENINYGTSLPDEGFVGQLFFVEDENLDGPSLPIGGTAGQVLTKNSSEDGDAGWTTDIAGNAGTATKLATARTISLTGDITGSGSFDGSDNLSITTTTNHNHDSNYIKKSGDTMTGELYMGTSSTTDGPAIVFPSNKRNYIWMGYANDNGSWYMWDSYNSKGIIASDINGNNTFYGNADTATKATQDGNGNIITSTYLPLTGGTMTGSLYIGDRLKLWSDGEGGNIRIFTQASTTNCFEFDGYDGNLRLYYSTDGGNGSTGYQSWRWGTDGSFTASKVYGAVWNDYAEFRICNEDFKPGQVVCENNDDTLNISTYRLQPGANIVSDTYGFAIGETDDAKCPIAVSGRVLAYTYEAREEFNAGDAVCAGPNGTVSKMTRDEVKEYPERIIGTVSAVPNYETWGSGNVPVNGRIWIKVR